MHNVCLDSLQQKVVSQISINNFDFDVDFLPFQSDRKVWENIKWVRISSIKGFQGIRRLTQRRGADGLLTRNRHDASGGALINNSTMNILRVNDDLNEKSNLMRKS